MSKVYAECPGCGREDGYGTIYKCKECNYVYCEKCGTCSTNWAGVKFYACQHCGAKDDIQKTTLGYESSKINQAYEQEKKEKELERERYWAEQERKEEAEKEYKRTHCFVCGRKGFFMEFHNENFHQECCDEFKKTEAGKNWIKEKEEFEARQAEMKRQREVEQQEREKKLHNFDNWLQTQEGRLWLEKEQKTENERKEALDIYVGKSYISNSCFICGYDEGKLHRWYKENVHLACKKEYMATEDGKKWVKEQDEKVNTIIQSKAEKERRSRIEEIFSKKRKLLRFITLALGLTILGLMSVNDVMVIWWWGVIIATAIIFKLIGNFYGSSGVEKKWLNEKGDNLFTDKTPQKEAEDEKTREEEEKAWEERNKEKLKKAKIISLIVSPTLAALVVVLGNAFIFGRLNIIINIVVWLVLFFIFDSLVGSALKKSKFFHD